MLKNVLLAYIVVSLFTLMSCQNDSQQIDLNEYRNLFSLRDSMNFVYWQFSSNDSGFEKYANKAYLAFDNFDSLEKETWIDSEKVFVHKRFYQIDKRNENEIVFHGIDRNGWIFRFSPDSIQLVDINDSNIVAVYSIPAKIKIGEPYISGNLIFVKNETLHFGATSVDCLVATCSSNRGTSKWSFWLNPEKLFVKVKTVDDDNNNELLLLDKKFLLSSQ